MRNFLEPILPILLSTRLDSTSTMYPMPLIHSSQRWNAIGILIDIKLQNVRLSCPMNQLHLQEVVLLRLKFKPYVERLVIVPPRLSLRIPKDSLGIQWVLELKMLFQFEDCVKGNSHPLPISSSPIQSWAIYDCRQEAQSMLSMSFDMLPDLDHKWHSP